MKNKIKTEIKIAIHRRLNLLNGEDLTIRELDEETKGMTNEILSIINSTLDDKLPAWKYFNASAPTEVFPKGDTILLHFNGYEIDLIELFNKLPKHE